MRLWALRLVMITPLCIRYLSRRYARLGEEGMVMPDVVLIDGGRGQLAQARAVLDARGVTGVTLLGVAKGPERNRGWRHFTVRSGPSTYIPSLASSAALHLIQQIRDEAHRFAITGHRQRRMVSRKTSALENIPGIGPKRRQALLRQFGVV